MKIKVGLYGQQYIGTPLTEIDDPIILNFEDDNANPFPEITKAVVTLLRDNISQLDDQEVATLVERNGIDNVLDLNELNVYLQSQGLRLIVANTLSGTIPDLADGQFTVVVMTPMNSMLPMRTDYVVNTQDLYLPGIIGDIISKFGIGRGLVPSNQLVNLVSVLNQMTEQGLPETPMYLNTLMEEVYKYGIEILYIYQ